MKRKGFRPRKGTKALFCLSFYHPLLHTNIRASCNGEKPSAPTPQGFGLQLRSDIRLGPTGAGLAPCPGSLRRSVRNLLSPSSSLDDLIVSELYYSKEKKNCQSAFRTKTNVSDTRTRTKTDSVFHFTPCPKSATAQALRQRCACPSAGRPRSGSPRSRRCRSARKSPGGRPRNGNPACRSRTPYAD